MSSHFHNNQEKLKTNDEMMKNRNIITIFRIIMMKKLKKNFKKKFSVYSTKIL